MASWVIRIGTITSRIFFIRLPKDGGTFSCISIEQAVAGNHLGDIGHAVQAYAESFGYSVVRDYVGHGIGTDMHEDPEVPNYGMPGHGELLEPGMVLALEPMINMGTEKVRQLKNGWTVVTQDGKPAAHFEHTVAITENGPEILTLPDE